MLYIYNMFNQEDKDLVNYTVGDILRFGEKIEKKRSKLKGKKHKSRLKHVCSESIKIPYFNFPDDILECTADSLIDNCEYVDVDSGCNESIENPEFFGYICGESEHTPLKEIQPIYIEDFLLGDYVTSDESDWHEFAVTISEIQEKEFKEVSYEYNLLVELAKQIINTTGFEEFEFKNCPNQRSLLDFIHHHNTESSSIINSVASNYLLTQIDINEKIKNQSKTGKIKKRIKA